MGRFNLKFVKPAATLAIGAAVLTGSFAVTGATDTAFAKAATVKVSKGKLVSAKSGKVVKGYKVYNKVLYKNGVKFTGVYKSTYYKSGKKGTGIYKNVYYKSGKKGTGVYKNVYYKAGKKGDGWYGTGSAKKWYQNGKPLTGLGKSTGRYFKAGKLATGVYKEQLYIKGNLNKEVTEFEGKLYNGAKLAEGVVTYKGEENYYEKGLVVATSVASVSAVNESTINISGVALGKLKAADVTVAGVEVVSLTPSADWKTATVALKGTLPANKDVKASVKVGTETKEFTVNYAFDPKAVAVQEGTYDDDTRDQKLVLLVDGQAKSADYLRASGYTVEFRAFDKDDKEVTNSFFTAGSSVNDGTLASVLPEGSYKIIAQIHKAGKILTSEKASIKVTNLNNAATSVNGYELYNNTLASNQNSTTLFVGETADLKNIEVGVGSNKTVVNANTANVKVESSDSSIVSVDATTKQLKANKIGTVTIKVIVGTAVKEITLTVSGSQRYADSVDAKNTTILSNKSAAQSFKVLVKDQYGDPVTNLTAANSSFVANFNTGIAGLTGATLDTSGSTVSGDKLVTDGKGYATIQLTATPGTTPTGKSGSVVIKEGSSVITSFTVTTTDNDAEAKKEFGIDSSSLSKDNVIDKELNGKDDTVTFAVKSLNKEGVVLNGNVDVEGYKIKFDDKVVKVRANSSSGAVITSDTLIPAGTTKLFVEIAGKGTTSIVLTKGSETISTSVSVNTASTALKAVNWIGGNTNTKFDKSGKINYETVLDMTPGAGDPEFKAGVITLTSPVLNSIRLHISNSNESGASTAVGSIYIDKDNNGKYSTGDVVLGSLDVAVSTGAENLPITSAITGVTVGTGTVSKGIITFAVKDNGGDYVAQKSVDVDVKGTTLDQQDLAAAQGKVNGASASYNAGNYVLTGAAGVSWTLKTGGTSVANGAAATRTNSVQSVVLVASATVGTQTATKEYTVSVPAKTFTLTAVNLTGVTIANDGTTPGIPTATQSAPIDGISLTLSPLSNGVNFVATGTKVGTTTGDITVSVTLDGVTKTVKVSINAAGAISAVAPL